MSVRKVTSPRTGRISWEVRVNYVGENGRRRQAVRRAATRAEAKKLEAQIIDERDDGALASKSERLSLTLYLDQWLGQQSGLRGSTIRRYRERLAHIDRELGRIPPTKLVPLNVVGFYDSLVKRGLSARTILDVHRTFHRAMSDAERWGLVSRNVVDLVQAPRVRPHGVRVIPLDQLRRIFETADATPIGALTRVAALTGMRLGELLGLTWADVDLVAGTLHIKRSRNTAGEITETKTLRSNRRLSLSPDTVDLLTSLWTKRPGAGPVFVTTQGRIWSQQGVYAHWKDVRDAADAQGVRFHDLRHAHASYMIAAGFSIPVVSERLGHSQPSTTLNVYSHALAEQDRALAAAVDGLMR